MKIADKIAVMAKVKRTAAAVVGQRGVGTGTGQGLGMDRTAVGMETK